MNRAGACLSPKFKNLKGTQRHSPIELKEKMRKNYKEKLQNCRNMLMNRFRDTNHNDLKNTLVDIYKNMTNSTNTTPLDDEENIILEEIKNELIQEEFQWWLEEYDKTQTDVDWSSLEQENNVICPVCQKNNLELLMNKLSCSHCNSTINTEKSLNDVKLSILQSLEKHCAICKDEFEFAVLPDSNENHMYLICSSCSEMQIVV